MVSPDSPRTIGVVLFEGFELLDVFGPLEMFGVLDDRFSVNLLGPARGPVASAQGPSAVADVAYRDAGRYDIVLVPGGIGTRRLADDQIFLTWLRNWASSSEFITSVCTGSGLLAAAGLLEGYRATSNKQAFAWASSQGNRVEWVVQARWVEDRNRWTSSGVTAGIDMALALIGRLHGEALAAGLADAVEYDRHLDPSWDPFAARAGLLNDR